MFGSYLTTRLRTIFVNSWIPFLPHNNDNDRGEERNFVVAQDWPTSLFLFVRSIFFSRWFFIVFDFCGIRRVTGENLVSKPPVQDETGATRKGHARGSSRCGSGQRVVFAEARGGARAGAGRQAVHQSAARRRQNRTNGPAVVFASADARPDAPNVVVTVTVTAVTTFGQCCLPVCVAYKHVYAHVMYIIIFTVSDVPRACDSFTEGLRVNRAALSECRPS